ncbi:MAG: hypothetical protein GC148_04835 [Hyphomonas sp.]|nr:hypothetical protein [Hyphomonas sp.]
MTWQLSHAADVAICVAGLPVAVDPLWQDAQLPVTVEWSNRADDHVEVTWQSSQAACVRM